MSPPVEMVRHLGAVQSQDFARAKWSLGLRLRPTSDAIIEKAFNDGDILRTHILRPTWHFVTPADIRWMLALTGLRVHQVNAGMYRQVGMDGPDRSGQRMAYILMNAELDGIICSGPRRGKQFTYMLLDERAPDARSKERDEALAELARRYFLSRGPATVHDYVKWSGLTVADARRGIEALENELRREEVGSKIYWLPPELPLMRDPSPTTYLLSIYDEYISGYKEHGAIRHEEIGARLAAMGNALQNIIVIDGLIAGTWRRVFKKTPSSSN